MSREQETILAVLGVIVAVRLISSQRLRAAWSALWGSVQSAQAAPTGGSGGSPQPDFLTGPAQAPAGINPSYYEPTSLWQPFPGIYLPNQINPGGGDNPAGNSTGPNGITYQGPGYVP